MGSGRGGRREARAGRRCAPARRRPVLLGSLGRTTPVSRRWGYDRGTPVDGWYIERFLAEQRAAITGRVLEVKDNGYTDRFGHDVVEKAVLDVDAANDRATYVADLADLGEIPDGSFDCFVLTQTLQYVWDLRPAVRHAHRVLAHGGVLLATVPVTSRVTGDRLSSTSGASRPTPAAGSSATPSRPARSTSGAAATSRPRSRSSHGLAAEELAEDEPCRRRGASRCSSASGRSGAMSEELPPAAVLLPTRGRPRLAATPSSRSSPARCGRPS